MAGRPRLPIGTFGEITVRQVGSHRCRASTRFRDWDGQTRQVSATAEGRAAAKRELKLRIAERVRRGNTDDRLTAESNFRELADAWLEDLLLDVDRSDGTKEVYERELRTLVMPTFQSFVIREITVGRVERFLRVQREKSYARAKHSRTILSMVMGFAVRREIIPRDPVKETSRLKKPKKTPKALTSEQIASIRSAARDWRTGEGQLGPHPDGQVRDLIEVMLGSATRIGEALAIRKCDVDMASDPPTIDINGTIVVRKGRGVTRQPKPKTDESNRLVAVPPFTAAVIRRRLVSLAEAPDDDLLFHTRMGTPLAPHNARRTFRAMLKSVGLEDVDVTPHAFRRTGATLIARETNLEAAAEVLGHSTTGPTKEHYAEPARTANPASARVLQALAPLGDLIELPRDSTQSRSDPEAGQPRRS